MPKMELHYADEWAALYVDGKLADNGVGDAYRVEELAFEMAGVKQVKDDAFMRGQNQYDGVARTLDEVDEYRWARDNRAEEAKRLREEAEALIARAAELESGK